MEDTSKINPQQQSDIQLPSTQDPMVIEQASNPEDLDSRWLRWKCLNCGYLYEGVQELKKCPKCGNENPDMFEDAD